MSHYIILHQSYSRFLFPDLTWRIPSLSCLARCARRVNEPSPKLRPRVVACGWQPWWERPSGLHPHHPRDAATPTVSAGNACVIRQSVDGSSLWRLFRAFRGRAEMHRVVMCMVYVVHVSRNTNNEMILYGDSIHKEVWKLLKGEWTPVANGGVWCGAKCWFQVKHIDDRPLDFASRSSSPEPAASRFHRQIPQDLTDRGGLIMLY